MAKYHWEAKSVHCGFDGRYYITFTDVNGNFNKLWLNEDQMKLIALQAIKELFRDV